MADWFVDDAASDNTGTGAWDDPLKYLWQVDGSANPGLFNLGSPPNAGDRVFVLTGHNEVHTASVTLTNNGTNSSPISIFSVESFNSGSPDTLGAAKSCFVGNSSYASGRDIIPAGVAYCYGFDFTAGDEVFGSLSSVWSFEACQLKQLRTGGYGIRIGYSSAEVKWSLVNSDVVFLGDDGFSISYGGILQILGGSITCTSGNALLGADDNFYRGGRITCSGVDLSNVDVLHGSSTADNMSGWAHLLGCKIPAGFSVGGSDALLLAVDTILSNSDSSATNKRLQIERIVGAVREETTVTRVGGADNGDPSDGDYSIAMDPDGTNIPSYAEPLIFAISGYADFSSSKQIEIHFATNAAANLTDADIYGILEYPTYNAGGNTTEAIVSSADAKIDGGTAWPTVTVSGNWSGSPARAQKMSVTAGGSTVGRYGQYKLHLYLIGADTVYVCPKPVIT